jgi:hypothetical protein
MFSRTSSALLLLAAATSCSSQPDAEDEATVGAGQGSVSPATTAKIPCALRGARTFSADCTVEREIREGRTILTLRHPDGGFRRLLEIDAGKSYAAADGSAPVELQANGSEIEVTLGDDHYLFAAPTDAPAR